MAARLEGIATDIVIVELPDLVNEGEDVSDWLNKYGGTVEKLQALVEEARRKPREPIDAPPEFTEIALAVEFVKRHGDALKYVALWGHWLLWTGTHWKQEPTVLAFDLARKICSETARQALVIEGKKVAAALAKASTCAAVERIAKADRKFATTIDPWDADLMALNTPGGTVDLRTGALRQHQREDYCTKITAVAPAAVGTQCPKWLEFLNRIMTEDAELIAFIQRATGYALTGSVKEHAIFFAYGCGANGKGTLTRTVTKIMHNYTQVAGMETFTATNSYHHPTDVASLRGARLVTAQETEEGRRWAEAKIKNMTGGDPLRARFMRQDEFTFQPQFKLWIAGNHKPSLRSVDEAIRRRFHLIPFTVTIPREERIGDFEDRFISEWPAILRWLIDGCLQWQERGLRPTTRRPRRHRRLP